MFMQSPNPRANTEVFFLMRKIIYERRHHSPNTLKVSSATLLLEFGIFSFSILVLLTRMHIDQLKQKPKWQVIGAQRSLISQEPYVLWATLKPLSLADCLIIFLSSLARRGICCSQTPEMATATTSLDNFRLNWILHTHKIEIDTSSTSFVKCIKATEQETQHDSSKSNTCMPVFADARELVISPTTGSSV